VTAQPSPIPNDPSTDGVVPVATVKALCGQYGLSVPELMLALVPFAEALAQPLISRYPVGAVAQGITSGALYYGANMEFAGQALPLTVHAEQSATTNAWEHDEQGLTSIAVSAAPCGYCRQFLYETNRASLIQVYLPDTPPASLSPGLLPDAFGPGDLGVTSALMAPSPPFPMTLTQPSSAPVVLAALAAAQASYAPYTFSHAGAAVETADGLLFAGRLAENAAYNPSMSPAEGALTMLSLAGVPQADVTMLVLVELVDPPVSQIRVTQAVAEALPNAAWSVQTARTP
jgi:cytidine deaminase